MKRTLLHNFISSSSYARQILQCVADFGKQIRSGAQVGQPRQQCCFFKCSAASAAVVLVFRIQDCFCPSSVTFSKAMLYLRKQCCFLKFQVLLFAAALLFQIQRCICRSSANFSNPRLLLPQQCCFFRFNTAFAAAAAAFSNSTLQTPQQRCFCKFSHAAGSTETHRIAINR